MGITVKQIAKRAEIQEKVTRLSRSRSSSTPQLVTLRTAALFS